ncbi:MAG: biopolymer transporter ExbD [Deltaproteobacteria bacterium]|nr:biopolymer transporter ExbD [Deltaproteobacteria bacterium]
MENPNDLSQFEPAPEEFSVRNRKKKREVEEPGPLTITSLMDILTILLVFLLKSFSANPVNITMSDDLQLPSSSATLEPEEAVPVAVTTRQILVNDVSVAEVIDGKVDVSTKRDGEQGFFIEPLFEALNKEADKQKRIAKHNTAQEFKGLALVIAHQDTNYRLLNEVLYTAGQAQFSQFKFAVIKKE